MPVRHSPRLPALLMTVLSLATASAHASVRVYAAGDIANCGGDPAAASDAAATARMIPDGAPVLVLGDTAYPRADAATLAGCYDPTWGRLKSTTIAAAGNHDYIGGHAKDFLDYFGDHNHGHTYYRTELGGWWVFVLDSNLKGRPEAKLQQAWLEQQLAAIRGDGRCLMAIWHHPLFSTGLHRGDGVQMEGAWRALDAAGADLVLSGHEHFYESFEPRDVTGRPQATGIREFVVGTGGANLNDMSLSVQHRVLAREYGVLELELEAERYHWSFRTVGGDVRDAGVAECRRPAQSVKRTARDRRSATSSTSVAAVEDLPSTAKVPRPAGTSTPR